MAANGGAVIASICQHAFCFALSEQGDGLGAIVDLPRRNDKIQRQAVFVGQQMNLGRQSTSGTPQSLVFGAPFFGPVAACWCARTMVESIIRYWFFRSRTRA